MSFAAGTELEGYTLLRGLQTGGMAQVFLGAGPEGRVAIKVPASPQHAAALRFEARLLEQLDHPGVVRCLARGEHDGLPWYAMPLLEPWRTGGEATQTATEDAEPDAPIDLPQSISGLDLDGLSALCDLCSTLAWLHGSGVVHRDLKPGNLMVSPEGRVVLVDLGIAARTAIGGREQGLFEAGSLGTPGHMAPEQLRGEAVDARTDLYAVGVMLFELLTGRAPFLPRHDRSLREQHLHDPAPVPSSLNPAVPARLDTLVAGLLAKSRVDRPGYADQVVEALCEAGAKPPEPGPVARPYLYRPAFTGREEALDRAGQELSASAEGHGGLLFVEGPSGIGKTRFAQAVGALAAADGRQVVGGACEADTEAPLGLFRPVLRAVADRCRTLPPETVRDLYAHHLGVLAPIEPTLVGLGPGSEGTAAVAERQEQLVRSALAVLHGFAQSARPLLVLDDVQWADEVSRAVLEALVDSPTLATEASFLLLARPSQGPALHGRRLQALALDPLGEPALRALIGQATGNAALDPIFVERIVRDSAGSPLLTVSLLELAIQEQVLARQGGHWVARDIDRFDVPAELDALLATRVQTLDADATRLLQAGAVLGSTFDLRQASELAGLDLEATLASVRALVLVDALERRGAWELRFTHGRLRDAAEATLAQAERAELHGRAAALRTDAPARERYRHQRLAGQLPQATATGLQAAQDALDAGMVESTLALLDELPTGDASQRADRERLLAACCAARGDHDGARAHAEAGLAAVGHRLPRGSVGWSLLVVRELAARTLGSSPTPDARVAELLGHAWEGYLRTHRTLPYLGSTLLLLRQSGAVGDQPVHRGAPRPPGPVEPPGWVRWAGPALVAVLLLGLGATFWGVRTVQQAVTAPPRPPPLAADAPVVMLPEQLRVQLAYPGFDERLREEAAATGLDRVVRFVETDPDVVVAEASSRPVLVEPGTERVLNRFVLDDQGRIILEDLLPVRVLQALQGHARNQGLLALEGVGGTVLTNDTSLQVRAARSAQETGCERGTWQDQTPNTRQILPACNPWHVEVRNDATVPLFVGGVVLSGDGTRLPIPAESPSVRVEPGATVALDADWPFTPGPPYEVVDHLLIAGSTSAPIDWRVLARDGGHRGLASVGASDVEGLLLALVSDERGQTRQRVPSPVSDPWTTTRVELWVPQPSDQGRTSEALCDPTQRCGHE